MCSCGRETFVFKISNDSRSTEKVGGRGRVGKEEGKDGDRRLGVGEMDVRERERANR